MKFFLVSVFTGALLRSVVEASSEVQGQYLRSQQHARERKQKRHQSDSAGEESRVRERGLFSGSTECNGETLAGGESLGPGEHICYSSSEYGTNYHRFGLDINGRLGERHGQFSEGATEDIKWSTETVGSRLFMQRDGNVVLRDEAGNAVWSSGCRAEGATLYKKKWDTYTMTEDEQRVWEMSPTQEKGSCHPPTYCHGTILEGTDTLPFNHYLCQIEPEHSAGGYYYYDDEFTYRFGVNNGGRLVLMHEGEVIWTAGNNIKGPYARMQQDGNLVLRAKSGEAAWAANCKEAGSTVEMKANGILMIKPGGTVGWYIDYDGNDRSQCDPLDFPEDPCQDVSIGSNPCRMELVTSNGFHVVMQVEKEGPNEFLVTDDAVSCSCWEKQPTTLPVTVSDAGAMTSEGTMWSSWWNPTCQEIASGDIDNIIPPEEWGGPELAYNDFEADGYVCTEFGKHLIEYVVKDSYFYQWGMFGLY